MNEFQQVVDMVLPRFDDIERVEVRTVSYDDDYGATGRSVRRVRTGVVLYFRNVTMLAVVPTSLTLLAELIYWFYDQMSTRESTRQEFVDRRKEANVPTLYVGRHRVVI